MRLRPKIHLLTLVIVTVVAGELLWLNMRSPQITKRVVVGDKVIAYISFPQFPIGTEYQFTHYARIGCQTPEETLHIIRELDFSEQRPDLMWNLLICVAILFFVIAIVEYVGRLPRSSTLLADTR